jgi:hypothetical protein
MRQLQPVLDPPAVAMADALAAMAQAAIVGERLAPAPDAKQTADRNVHRVPLDGQSLAPEQNIQAPEQLRAAEPEQDADPDGAEVRQGRRGAGREVEERNADPEAPDRQQQAGKRQVALTGIGLRRRTDRPTGGARGGAELGSGECVTHNFCSIAGLR